ncbi:MAG: hypothetical protein ACLFRQ_07995 [Desulfonatronovibrio sp.]
MEKRKKGKKEDISSAGMRDQGTGERKEMPGRNKDKEMRKEKPAECTEGHRRRRGKEE